MQCVKAHKVLIKEYKYTISTCLYDEHVCRIVVLPLLLTCNNIRSVSNFYIHVSSHATY